MENGIYLQILKILMKNIKKIILYFQKMILHLKQWNMIYKKEIMKEIKEDKLQIN